MHHHASRHQFESHPYNPLVEVWAWGQGGVIRDAGYHCDDVTYAVLTLADGALVNCNVSFALPAQYPSLGYCGRVEIIGKDGVLMIDDACPHQSDF